MTIFTEYGVMNGIGRKIGKIRYERDGFAKRASDFRNFTDGQFTATHDANFEGHDGVSAWMIFSLIEERPCKPLS